MITYDKRMTRVQVEVDGYTWRIHGRQTGSQKYGLRWQSHLVELIGPLPLDCPITLALRDKLRSALAKALNMDEVPRIPVDLILA
jgi:phage baseplate assembly protein W